MEKIRTIIWFLRRPHLYPQLFYQFKQSFLPHKKEKTRKLATETCLDLAINHIQLFTKLGINPVELEEIHKEDIETAKRIEKQIPISMGGGGDGNLLYNILLHYKPEISVETGVAYGWSSLAILLALEANEKGKLLSTDMPYAKMNNENFVGSVVPARLREKWELIRLPDRQGLVRILKKYNKLDLIHYDSDKSYRGRLWAYKKLWKHLKAGGVLISDDINDNIGFFDFSKIVGVEPLVVAYENKFIGILIKSNE